MPNLSTILKGEITRLARKEIKAAVDPVRKANAGHRREIAELKRQVASLQRDLKSSSKPAKVREPEGRIPREPALLGQGPEVPAREAGTVCCRVRPTGGRKWAIHLQVGGGQGCSSCLAAGRLGRHARYWQARGCQAPRLHAVGIPRAAIEAAVPRAQWRGAVPGTTDWHASCAVPAGDQPWRHPDAGLRRTGAG